MDVSLALLLNLYAFSTGRRIWAMTQTGKAATAAGLNALAAHCDQAIAADATTREIESRWASDKDASTFAPEARAVDTLVDIALGALRDAINAEARDAAPGDPLAEDAAKLELEAFPQGVAAITTLGFVDELSEVQRIITLLDSPAWSIKVEKLGLHRRVLRLKELEKRYAAALALSPKSVTFDQVKAARRAGQNLMLQAVAMILGLYPSESEADVAARRTLLAPILQQNEAIRDYLRARRTVEDVNPTTGEVDPTAPPATPPPAPPAQPPAP